MKPLPNKSKEVYVAEFEKMTFPKYIGVHYLLYKWKDSELLVRLTKRILQSLGSFPKLAKTKAVFYLSKIGVTSKQDK